MNAAKRFAVAVAAGIAVASLSAAAATGASAAPHGACYLQHPGFTGTQTSASGFSLAISGNSAQAIFGAPNFNSPFLNIKGNSCFDQTHPAAFNTAGEHGLLVTWHFGGAARYLAEGPNGTAVFVAASAGPINSSEELVFDPATNQLNDKATGDALSLSGGFFGTGGASFVPAGHGQLATQLHFTPAS
jgi:hypothetical protein